MNVFREQVAVTYSHQVKELFFFNGKVVVWIVSWIFRDNNRGFIVEGEKANNDTKLEEICMY